jgi:hypothetical protein
MHTLVGAVGLGLGVASIVLSIVIHRRERLSKRLFYRVAAPWNRIRTHNGVVLHLALWNGGSLPVRSTDIPRQPITISSVERQRLTRAGIYSEPDPNNEVSIELQPDRTSAAIEFHYLNPGDGALFEVTFEGVFDQEIVMRGAVIGGEGPTLRGEPSTISVLAIFVPLLLLGWAFVLLGLSSDDAVIRFALVGLGIVFYPLVVGPVYALRRNREIPPDLHRGLESAPASAAERYRG